MHQNTFQVVEWSDAHQEGLSIPDRVEMIRMEDVRAAKLVNYVEPQSIGVEPYKSAAEAITDLVVTLAKPAIVLSVVGGVIWVVIAGVVAMAGAILAFASANAMWIGGVGFVVVFLFVSLASFFNSGEEGYKNTQSNTPPQTINVTVNVAGQNVTANGK